MSIWMRVADEDSVGYSIDLNLIQYSTCLQYDFVEIPMFRCAVERSLRSY